mmetsp:Transcript_2639/g.5823  ORF Transcript_2639/g.5823 Transcript_2639/m.5823 type:complete len:219 (+) Transcript_2639:1273-1929(+)
MTMKMLRLAWSTCCALTRLGCGATYRMMVSSLSRSATLVAFLMLALVTTFTAVTPSRGCVALNTWPNAPFPSSTWKLKSLTPVSSPFSPIHSSSRLASLTDSNSLRSLFWSWLAFRAALSVAARTSTLTISATCAEKCLDLSIPSITLCGCKASPGIKLTTSSAPDRNSADLHDDKLLANWSAKSGSCPAAAVDCAQVPLGAAITTAMTGTELPTVKL